MTPPVLTLVRTADVTVVLPAGGAHHNVPTRRYVVDTPLPRTASGKLMEHQLRVGVERGEICAAEGKQG